MDSSSRDKIPWKLHCIKTNRKLDSNNNKELILDNNTKKMKINECKSVVKKCDEREKKSAKVINKKLCKEKQEMPFVPKLTGKSNTTPLKDMLKFSEIQNRNNRKQLMDNLKQMEENTDLAPEVVAAMVEMQEKPHSFTVSRMFNILYSDIDNDESVMIGCVPGSSKETVPLSSNNLVNKHVSLETEYAKMLDSAYAIQIPRRSMD